MKFKSSQKHKHVYRGFKKFDDNEDIDELDKKGITSFCCTTSKTVVNV